MRKGWTTLPIHWLVGGGVSRDYGELFQRDLVGLAHAIEQGPGAHDAGEVYRLLPALCRYSMSLMACPLETATPFLVPFADPTAVPLCIPGCGSQ